MIKYQIKDYGNAGLMLIREASRIPSAGLPPTYSSCIMLEREEINDLLKVIQEYADKRGN